MDQNQTPPASAPTDITPITPLTTAVADVVPGQEVAKVETVPTLEEKLEAAKVAMEGPERSAKRIHEEKESRVKGEEVQLNTQKAKLDKQKETLELGWIDLDEKRNSVKKDLQPVLDQETKIEEEAKAIEAEEERAALPDQKQLVEKRRWDNEDKRRALEKQKWGWQDKLEKIEKLVEENTKQYQEILDQEEKINAQLSQLETELV
ncbi:MAG: hypothetical protein AAB645_01380 [Patescibacteria group bacterium]